MRNSLKKKWRSHSFKKYLLSTFYVLDTWDTLINPHKMLVLMELIAEVGKKGNSQKIK